MDSLPGETGQTRVLLAQAHAGDAEAIDRLLARHRLYLRRIVELRLDPKLRQRVDPSDVVQEAQLEAARRLPAYLSHPTISFRLWLRRIAYDRLLMMRRKHLEAGRRSIARELPLPDRSTVDLGRRLLSSASTPSQQMVRGELGRRVRQALCQLAEPDREIILMRNFEGLANQEAAEVLGIEPSAANKRYGRALLRLRQVLLDGGMTGSVQ